MKKLTFLFLALFVLLLSACAPVAQKFVDLPVEQEIAITSIIVAVVALGFDWAIGRFPWLSFFLQYREAWSLALSALAIKGLENVLPTGSDPISIPAVGLLIAVLLFLLGRTVLKRRGVQAFR